MTKHLPPAGVLDEAAASGDCVRETKAGDRGTAGQAGGDSQAAPTSSANRQRYEHGCMYLKSSAASFLMVDWLTKRVVEIILKCVWNYALVWSRTVCMELPYMLYSTDALSSILLQRHFRIGGREYVLDKLVTGLWKRLAACFLRNFAEIWDTWALLAGCVQYIWLWIYAI